MAENRSALDRAGSPTSASRPRSGNPLPRPLTSFIGREVEISTCLAYLRDSGTRLLTLTGPGGIGKSRLALRLASEVSGSFANGAVWADFSALPDHALTASTIANGFGLRESGHEPVDDRLQSVVRDLECLLILDNFDTVIDAAPLIAGLLSSAPGLVVLATSRMRLRISGEHEFPVPPLRLAGEDAAHDETGRADSVRLFAERARVVAPDFSVTAENAAAVSGICRRLDGLPLAIELAASWIRVLRAPELQDRLERRLPLLTGGGRDQPERQRTMAATIAWSYDRLTPLEQRYFRRLAIFADGCTLAAAEAVVPESPADVGDVLPCLGSLVEKSMLRAEMDAANETRYRMLETIREFGVAKLIDCGELISTRGRHAAFFLRAVDADDLAPLAPGPIGGVDRLERDAGNLRIAFDHLCTPETAEECLLLTAGCLQLWYERGNVGEGWERASRALELPGAAGSRARGLALIAACLLAIARGNYDALEALAREALVIWRQLGDRRHEAGARHYVTMADELNLRWDAAEEGFQVTLAMWRELGDSRMVACTLALLSGVLYGKGRIDDARSMQLEALTLFRVLDDRRWTGGSLWYLGMFSISEHRFARAAGEFRESLQELLAIADASWPFKPMVGLADVAASCGRPGLAARFLGAADAVLQRGGSRLLPFDRPAYERATAAARSALSETDLASALATGRAWTPAQLFQEADAVVAAAESIDRSGPTSRTIGPDSLTAREREVLTLLAEGKTDRAIAETLLVSLRTVNVHVASIFGKLGVHSRHEATLLALRLAGPRDSPPGAGGYT